MVAFLLLESGAPDNLLLETGDNLLLDDGTGITTALTSASQVTLEAVVGGQVRARASQVTLEVIIGKVVPAQVNASQVVLEVIVKNPAGFPALRLYG